MPDPLQTLAGLPTVEAATDRARAAIDAMLRHRVLRRRGEQVAAESVLRGAWAAAVGGGSSLTLDEVRAGTVDEPVMQGALRVYGELTSLAATWRTAPGQALARLHTLAAADLVAPEALGRPRPAAAQRLAALGEVVTTTRAAAPVVSAVVRGEVLALDAFAPVSSVVADAAVRLVIITAGLDPSSRSVPEVGARELAAAEPALLTDYAGGGTDAVAAWVEHVAQILVLGARETVAICEALQR